MLIGDYEFGRHPQDMALLEKISGVAAAAHAPFIAAAGPKLFDMDSFTELGGPRDLAKIFESAELIKWRSFRDSEDSRYVALVLPHVLMRLPYGPDTTPVEGINFVEDVDGRDHDRSTSGATPPGRWPSGSPTPSPGTAGPRPSAASRAAARSRGCRSTPSRPTRATSP
jgi:type VI secretion system ImpC/EvpB family protein